MFLEILRTLVQVLCVFSILIIAFGLSFYILLSIEVRQLGSNTTTFLFQQKFLFNQFFFSKQESKAFSTPPLSLLKTFMMMLELDYMASFNEQYTDDREDTLHFGTLTLTLLTIFVLLMPILLMNLLVLFFFFFSI